ncbi:LLM class flavin-dependent oxidoreductase [Streptomyces kutzneri]|uniref:LLM class flavin-dependent oxidoreductase n=1 Tax=Streptomyces kutzneri TaxID=3051179 RepID=UPI0028D80887|nr:LLM class flavin-dependent oxidoreductase [Streptomyces sp. DSM 40907]
MVRIGYMMTTEQAGPRELVDHVVAAERAGFGFSVISDRSFPWLEAQGYAPCAWSVLGAAAQATSRIPLMTYVTWPTFRYHPAVIAQKAATMQLLSQGRFRTEDVAEAIPCGDGVDAFVDAVRPYVDAGFTEVALIQIGGGRQEPFLDWSETKLLPALGAVRTASSVNGPDFRHELGC